MHVIVCVGGEGGHREEAWRALQALRLVCGANQGAKEARGAARATRRPRSALGGGLRGECVENAHLSEYLAICIRYTTFFCL